MVVERRGGALKTAILAALLVGAGWLAVTQLPSLNPFGEKTIDRSPPPVLKAITKLSEYHAASAKLQQVVDVEKDAKLLPSFIKGSRTTVLATGSVDAVVDFSRLDGRNVRLSEDGTAATITLPAPRLDRARVDLAHTRVIARDRGLIDRVGSAFKDNPGTTRPLLLAAQRKLAAAAAADSQLPATARANTTQMLKGLLRGLGVERVTVRWQAPPRPAL